MSTVQSSEPARHHDAADGDLPRDPAILAKDAALQRRLRLATINPATGGCPPVMVDGLDIANDFIGTMPLRGRAHLALYAQLADDNPGHQVPEQFRAELADRREKTVAAVELHERFGGRVRVRDEHFGSDPRNLRRTTSWLDQNDELRICARKFDLITDRYERDHGVSVEFVEERDFDTHYSLGPAGEKSFISATRMLKGDLLRSRRVEWGDGDYRMHFEQKLPDGGTHTWSAESGETYEEYHDAYGHVHRVGGPAILDERCIEYRVKGITHRDRRQGPAVVGSDGRARFIENGRNVDDQIQPGTARAHGLQADPDGGWRVPNAEDHFNPTDAYYDRRLA